jgi:hypothetical protein
MEGLNLAKEDQFQIIGSLCLFVLTEKGGSLEIFSWTNFRLFIIQTHFTLLKIILAKYSFLPFILFSTFIKD